VSISQGKIELIDIDEICEDLYEKNYIKSVSIAGQKLTNRVYQKM
jgi:hypothetical protein